MEGNPSYYVPHAGKAPSRVLNSLWRPVWPLFTATQEEARYFHRQIAPIRDVIDRLGRAASI